MLLFFILINGWPVWNKWNDVIVYICIYTVLRVCVRAKHHTSHHFKNDGDLILMIRFGKFDIFGCVLTWEGLGAKMDALINENLSEGNQILECYYFMYIHSFILFYLFSVLLCQLWIRSLLEVFCFVCLFVCILITHIGSGWTSRDAFFLCSFICWAANDMKFITVGNK